MSSDSAEDVHPHQQKRPKTSDVHSPQCIGNAKPFDLESEDYIPGEEPQFSDGSKVLQHMEVDRELFQQHVQDVLDCFLRGGDCVALLCSLPSFASSIALLSDEVELRLMEQCFCFIAGQNREWKCQPPMVSIPIWLCHPWPLCRIGQRRWRSARVFLASSTWTGCSRHSTRFSIKTSLWTHVVSTSGLVIGWRPLATQDHALCSQLCTKHFFGVI